MAGVTGDKLITTWGGCLDGYYAVSSFKCISGDSLNIKHGTADY